MTPRALRARLDDLARAPGSQRAAARRLGISESSLSRARSGRIGQLDRVARAMGLLPKGDPESRWYTPAPTMVTVEPGEVIRTLRDAVRAAGSQRAYAMRCGSVGLQSHISKIVRGACAPLPCVMAPLGIHKVGAAWMKSHT